MLRISAAMAGSFVVLTPAMAGSFVVAS